MISLTIDGIKVEVEQGATVLDAARKANVRIPTLCFLEKINEIDYKTKEVKVEIDVLSDKPNQTHYRALLVHPQQMFK